MFFIIAFPYSLGEVELFEEANTLNSPLHILPEWYFLSQYAILRSVPSKGIGVLLIFLRIGILLLYPFTRSYVSPISGISSSIWWWE
jgi:quinol-cytochrome oxidoreductase complex cytochrome b subunit